ncbi:MULTISPECIES: hypothetical protein [unclassified Streptomyces]|uniref:hypothetical protein n=1 Tax=unclassified Streptomyces TaxID=2593676 RepID=UPI00081F1B85|nr:MULTISPECIES: hypothetical protein [unclassified Streptomyces]MYZ33936.1 hypothetical protein [Streptomyces sp. SID4917]SCF62833.1 hypothetical protein GA0115259_1003417 [Streptomyces sp. MnatMP-M17]
MTDAGATTPETIAFQLDRALRKRRGVRAIALYTYADELASLLYPPEHYPEMQADDRARESENLIRRACAALGGPTGRALEVLCAFTPTFDRTTLQRRREEAGAILSPYGIQADTVRRSYIWNDLMLELAIAIRGLMEGSSAPTGTIGNKESNPAA